MNGYVFVTQRKISWDDEPVVPAAPIQTPAKKITIVQPPILVEETTTTVVDGTVTVARTTRAYKHREGNGHKSTMTRKLLDGETDRMRNSFFMPKNGQIGWDDCVEFHRNALPPVVGIFQVTGFISSLHKEVAEGRTMLANLVAYEAWLRAKYFGTMWARYNKNIFVEVRRRNQELIASGRTPTARTGLETPLDLTPRFAAFPSNGRRRR